MGERRETVRAENPDITFSDLSKKLAAEWSALPDHEKNKYNEQAKRDKDRYDKEFAEYQHTDSYKQYLEVECKATANSNSNKKKKKAPSSPASSSKRPSLDESDQDVTVQEPPPHLAVTSSNCTSFDIPIFTEEFLDHNKARELELRQPRKQTSEFEEQNAVLGKHIDSMKSAISKLEVETVQQRQSNAAFQQQLDMIRQMVLSAFRGVQLPGNIEPVTPTTVDQFVAKLHSLTEGGTPTVGQQALLSTVKDIVARMDFSKIPA